MTRPFYYLATLLIVFAYTERAFSEEPDSPAGAMPPGRLATHKDVAFLPEGRTEKMDIYIPTNASGDLPCLIYIHGGGWGRGDKADGGYTKWLRQISDAGFVVASINYHLVSDAIKAQRKADDFKGSYYNNLEVTWPRNLKDCKSAVRFLRKNAREFQIDPDRIGVMGSSAGAHLAALVATMSPEAGLEPTDDELGDVSSSVKLAVGYYGIYDWMTWHKGTNRGAAINTDEKKELARIASPINHLDPKDPPFLLLHGTKDKVVPIDQSEAFAAKLKELGVEHRLVPFEGVDHSFIGKKDDIPQVIEYLKTAL